MTLKRKAFEEVIEKGGHVKADQTQAEWTNFTLRIKQGMLEDIGKALEETAGLTKTGFILQAIQEKLRKQ